MIIKMSQDKNLVTTKSGNTYQDENNAETLKIILPKEINGNSLKECSVYLSFVNQKGLGEVNDLTEKIVSYSDDYYAAEIPMHQTFTHEPGNIEMWLKVLHSPTQMVAKTNSVIYTVKSHRDIGETLPEQDLSIIDSLAMKIDATNVKVNKVADRVQNIVEGDEQITQPMFIGKIKNENYTEE